MKSVMMAAALFAGGLVLTGALGSVLQARAGRAIDATYQPESDARTDRWGWPVAPKREPPPADSGPPLSWANQA